MKPKPITSALVPLLLLAALAAPARAQPGPDMRAIPRPADPAAIPLDTGGVPGMPPESWFVDQGMRNARNISTATLTPVLPRPGTATGAAAIVLPGGAFAQWSVDNEGWPVARWLADHGIAALVLKYRLNATPSDLGDYRTMVAAKIRDAMAGHLDLATPPAALADAVQAVRLTRAHAKEWHIDPRRIGMIGFSAGAMTTLATVEAAPVPLAFVGILYGPMAAVAIPAGAPPAFIALAADDPLFGGQGTGLAESWRKSGSAYELHVFQAGGHGFGMGKPGTTSPQWPALLLGFLRANHLSGPQ